MTLNTIQNVIYQIVSTLADGEYTMVVRECYKSRLQAGDLAKAISDYGKTIVKPPSNFVEYLDCVAVRGRADPTWSVRAPLWTLEEGRSDLTLELTVTETERRTLIEIDDLRVT